MGYFQRNSYLQIKKYACGSLKKLLALLAVIQRFRFEFKLGPLAQSVEQRTFNPWVVGSIPTGPTISSGNSLRKSGDSSTKTKRCHTSPEI